MESPLLLPAALTPAWSCSSLPTTSSYSSLDNLINQFSNLLQRPPSKMESRLPGDGTASEGSGQSYSQLVEDTDHPDIDSRVICDAKQYFTKLRMAYPTWASSLDDLIDDPKGINLFQSYLEAEKCDTRYLQLLLACRGIKAHDNNKEKLIRAIFRKLIKNLPHISADTKQRIADKISSGVGLEDSIFSEVEKEAKEHICLTTYPNFIKSDMYLEYVQHNSLPQSAGSNSPSPPDNSGLAVLPEDSELPSHPKLSEKHLNHHNYLMNRMKNGAFHSKRPPEKNFTNCHAAYNPYLPASAIESDRQSVSSGGRTDSMLSLSTLGGVSSYSSGHPKRLLHKEEAPDQALAAFIPRTKKTQNPDHNLAERDPKRFGELLIRKLEAVIRERDAKERMKLALENCSGDSESDASNKLKRVPPQLLSAAIRDQGRDSSEAEAILDQHCSRVWKAWSSPPRTPSHPPSPPPYSQHYFHQHVHHHRTSTLHRPSGEVNHHSTDPSRHLPTDPSSHLRTKQMPNNHKTTTKVPEDQRKSTTTTTEDITIIGYQFAGQSVPYRAKFEGKQITLRQFKNLLPKKGNFRYFFKSSSNDFENCGVVLVEVEDDDEILPLWENKIYAEITNKS